MRMSMNNQITYYPYKDEYGDIFPSLYIQTGNNGERVGDYEEIKGAWLPPIQFLEMVHGKLNEFNHQYGLPFDEGQFKICIEWVIDIALLSNHLNYIPGFEDLVGAAWDGYIEDIDEMFDAIIKGEDANTVIYQATQQYADMISELANHCDFVDYYSKLGVDMPLTVVMADNEGSPCDYSMAKFQMEGYRDGFIFYTLYLEY